MNRERCLKHFFWYITVYISSFIVERYCQLAMLHNLCHSAMVNMKFTFLNLLLNLRTEYNRLRLGHKRVKAHYVASAFDGNDTFTISTMDEIAYAATLIRCYLLKLVRSISNSESYVVFEFQKTKECWFQNYNWNNDDCGLAPLSKAVALFLARKFNWFPESISKWGRESSA